MAQDGIQLITQIAISSHSPVTGKAIADQYRKLFPGYQEKLPIEAVEPQAPGAPIRIILGANGEAGIDVMMMPTPIPPDMLTFAYAMNPHWPEAREELQRCRAHVAVIALQRQDGRDNPIRNAICLTLISACLCNLVPAVGMFCPSGNALTPVRRLRELAAKMLTGEPPVEAWVQTIVTDAAADKGQRRLTAMTNGLRNFVGREIEIRPVAREREKLLDVVHQLLRFTLQRGAGFDEGDSVTLKDGDAACVRYAREGQRQGIPIFETRLVKPDAAGNLPPDAFGETPLPPKSAADSGTPPPEGLPAGQSGTENSGPEKFMTMIALARPTPISMHMLTAAIKRRFPGFKGGIMPVGGDGPEDASGNTHMLLVGNSRLVLMSIDAPMPPGHLNSSIAAAELVWPDARVKLGTHKAHIIVAAMGAAEGFAKTAGQAGDLTIVTAALCDIAPAIGVYWCSGDVVTKPEHFQQGALGSSIGTPPVDNWLQLRLFKGTLENGRPGVGMMTTGLMPFVGREIEFPPAELHPSVIAQRVIGTAHYLLANGPVVDHGHTIGISNSEAIRVRHLDRGRFVPRPVYELTLEVLDPSVSPNEPPPHLKAVSKPEPEVERQPASVQPLHPAAPVPAPAVAAAAPVPPPPKSPPDNAASRMVRNLRRPQS